MPLAVAAESGKGVTEMKRGRKPGTHFTYYTVYDNRTDELVCLDATAEEAAKAMGISIKTFYPIVANTLAGRASKWHIEKTDKKVVLE